MSAGGLRAANRRFFGRIEVQPVAAADAIETDTAEEFDLACAQAGLQADFNAGLAGVDVLVTDFDGVPTDYSAIVSENSNVSVIVNHRDGHGRKPLREAGVKLLILSTERSPVVRRRAEKLVEECIHGIDDRRLITTQRRVGCAADHSRDDVGSALHTRSGRILDTGQRRQDLTNMR